MRFIFAEVEMEERSLAPFCAEFFSLFEPELLRFGELGAELDLEVLPLHLVLSCLIIKLELLAVFLIELLEALRFAEPRFSINPVRVLLLSLRKCIKFIFHFQKYQIKKKKNK